MRIVLTEKYNGLQDNFLNYLHLTDSVGKKSIKQIILLTPYIQLVNSEYYFVYDGRYEVNKKMIYSSIVISEKNYSRKKIRTILPDRQLNYEFKIDDKNILILIEKVEVSFLMASEKVINQSIKKALKIRKQIIQAIKNYQG